MSASTFPARPIVAPQAVWAPPVPDQRRLSSGLPLYVSERTALPLISLRLQIPFGAADDGTAHGLAALTAAMLEESSGSLDSLARSAAIDRLAARFSVIPGRCYTTVAMDVHQDRFAAALPLFAEAVLAPAFTEDDWERVYERQGTGIEQSLDDNNVVASMVTPGLLFGEGHPYGHPTTGTLQSLEAISREDAEQAWRQHGHGGGAAFVAVGAITADELAAQLDAAFAPWAVRPRPKRTIPVVRPRPGAWFVDRPDAAQTVLRAVMPGPTGLDEPRAAIDLARIVLGGSFTSRLNQLLREQKGYTYGVRLGLSSWEGAGIVATSTSVQRESTAAALTDLIGVLSGAAGGFTDAELDRAKAQARSDLVDASESRAALAGSYALELECGRQPAALAAFAQAIERVDVDILSAAAKWFDPREATLILVGDRAATEPALVAAGFGPFEAIEP